MTTKEIKELLKLVNELDLAEVKIKNNDFEIKIRTSQDVKVQTIATAPALVASQPASAAPAMTSPASEATKGGTDASDAESPDYIEIKSPMVGTFYRSSAPEKPPFVQVGDNIAPGGVVCIIEAMKLFNEIESEVAGKVVKVMVDDSTPVEYDQVLFLVEPA